MITYSFLSIVCAAAHSGQVVCEEALALHVLRNWEEKLGEELGEAGGGGQERRGTLLSERHGQQATIGATASHIGQFGCACMGTTRSLGARVGDGMPGDKRSNSMS